MVWCGRVGCCKVLGDVYEGSFFKGKRQGEGAIKFASGKKAAGKWQNGALVSSEEDGVVKSK